MMTHAALLNPNQRAQCFTPSSIRARERQIRAPEQGVLGGNSRDSYPAHVTVCPYNGYITGINPFVRRVMSLTWTLKQMRANQRAPKHALTQPLHGLHGSTARARAPNLVAS